MKTLFVSIAPEEVAQVIDREIIGGSITGQRISHCILDAPANTKCIVLVYEKHYYRAGNRLTATVTIDDFQGKTRVTCVSGGGGEGIIRFDWGAAESFTRSILNELEKYKI